MCSSRPTIGRQLRASLIIAMMGSCAPWIATAAEAPAAAPAPAPAAAATFDVRELRVLGNTVLDARAIEAAVYSFTGPDKQMGDVEAARAALERLYHQRGFGTVFVDIPEQKVEDGIVRLHVTEAQLRQVRVTGERYFSGREIRAALPAAEEHGVPNLPALQSQLGALNAQTRDRQVVPVLKAGPVPGTVDLALRVADHLPFHGSVELNNQYTYNTTHLRAAAAMSYDDMFGRLDSFSLLYQVAPESPSESHVFATSYAFRLGPDNSNLTLQYINSKSDVAAIGTQGVLGSGSTFGLRWTQPLPATLSTQSFALEADYKHYTQSIVVSPTSGVDTPVDYIAFSTAYLGARAWSQVQSNWNASANLGFRGSPNNSQQFADKTYAAQPNYFYLRADGSLLVQMPAHMSLLWDFGGQYTADALIPNEELPIGGAASVRGYLEAEALGDSTLRSSLQLGGPQLKFSGDGLQLDEFLFFDIAKTYIVYATPDEQTRYDLRSWGAGLRFDAFSHGYASLTWADPLVNGPHTPKGSSTVLFVVRGVW